MNKENLLRMAEHIESVPQEHFDMGRYRGGEFDVEKTECNSVGCIVGHCTFLDAENIKNNFLYGNNTRINFTSWSVNFTEITNDIEWDYLFCAIWSKIDNTPTGAAKRIRHVIENGFPTKKQMCSELDGVLKPSYF